MSQSKISTVSIFDKGLGTGMGIFVTYGANDILILNQTFLDNFSSKIGNKRILIFFFVFKNLSQKFLRFFLILLMIFWNISFFLLII